MPTNSAIAHHVQYSEPVDEIAAALAFHDGDVRATVGTLIEDCRHLREQLALTQVAMSIGFTRGLDAELRTRTEGRMTMLAFNQPPLGFEAYWTPIGSAELADVPAVMFRSVPDHRTIASMWAFSTCVFNLPLATAIGQFFFLVDARRGSTLAVYFSGEHSTRPIWVPTIDIEQAATIVYEHCRNTRWQTFGPPAA
jgi:hypothetical protein